MSTAAALSPYAILFGMPSKIKAVFFRQLATMVQAGLPVGRAVNTASEVGCKSIGHSLAKMVEQGSTLSEAFSKYPYHFSRHEVALIKAGESSGQLDRQLNELARTAELDWQLKKSITSKLVYPVIVAHSVVILPPLFLLVTSGPAAYFQAVFALLIPAYILFGGTFVTYRMFRQHGGPRRFLDHAVAALPILGPPGKYGARIRFLQTLATLIEAGFIPGQAIPLAAESCDNFWLRDKVMASWEKLGREVSMSTIMRDSGAFDAFELGLVVSGEESGSFAVSLKKASESLQPEYEAQVHRLTVILPIILLFLVGGFVAYMAVKTMTGIFAPLSTF
jgi:type IV pilus assembly protein PilC